MKVDGSPESTYMAIWEIEQEHSRTRWTVTTFFLSVSFAILGASFQMSATAAQVQANSILGLSLSDIQRITGMLIFWFAYILFIQFNRYANFLRGQLRKMEKEHLVSFTIQTEADNFMYSKIKAAFSAKWLLLYFGALYTVIVLFMVIA
ncbi:MAG: hypothetical protein BWY63_01910 [Chloroflexi bacterium ADurb.Bin360]|nr:MAG: hypothetical protein BWY63_01910 [Chloroflexi bacterium ADurb.Bin360]